MTERTNPLLRQRQHSANYGQTIMVEGHAVPTEIHEYNAWLQSLEKRTGNWRVVEKGGHKQVEFMTERGSSDWLAEKGIAAPKIGRAA